ncbi:MAG TPA: hypothetical protein VFB45_14710 [Pseudolabrys sp.]|nr:hypothetical protein [Pseudolabrys sp.]
MARLTLGVLLFGVISFVPFDARAGSAPPALYNKSVLISWTESRDMKIPSTGRVIHRTTDIDYGIYISSAGRVFSQMGRQNKALRYTRMTVNQSGSSVGPDGNTIKTSNEHYGRSLSFQGRSITTTTKFESGARQIRVDFDEGFGSCRVTVVHANERNAPAMVHDDMNSRLFIVSAVDSSAPTCAIRDGNIFGG